MQAVVGEKCDKRDILYEVSIVIKLLTVDQHQCGLMIGTRLALYATGH